MRQYIKSKNRKAKNDKKTFSKNSTNLGKDEERTRISSNGKSFNEFF